MNTLTKAIEDGKQRGRSKSEQIDDVQYVHDAAIQKVNGKYRVHVSKIREQDMASEQYEIYFTREFESLPLAVSCLEENSPIKFSELAACKGQRIFNADLLEENDR